MERNIFYVSPDEVETNAGKAALELFDVMVDNDESIKVSTETKMYTLNQDVLN